MTDKGNEFFKDMPMEKKESQSSITWKMSTKGVFSFECKTYIGDSEAQLLALQQRSVNMTKDLKAKADQLNIGVQ